MMKSGQEFATETTKNTQQKKKNNPLLVFKLISSKRFLIKLDLFSSSFAEINDVKNSESDSFECGIQNQPLIYTNL